MVASKYLHKARIAARVKVLRAPDDRKQHKCVDSASKRYLLHDTMGASQSDISSLSDGELVDRIRKRISSVGAARAREVGGVFLFNVIKGQTVYCWTLDLNKITVYEGEPEEEPDTTLTLTEHNLRQMVSGKEDPRQIMQAGRCSVTGDIMRAMKLEPYITFK